MMNPPITYLFVPGNRPDRFDKALACGADAVVLDLEDGVAPHEKDSARADVAHWLTTHASVAERILVRINAVAAPCFDADLALLRRGSVRRAMLPKVESAGDVGAVRMALPPAGGVVALIETARGMAGVDAIAAAGGVVRLAFGTEDYAADLGLSGDLRGLQDGAARIALASRLAELPGPIAGVTVALDDAPTLRSDVASARAFGFAAKLCIHPRQVPIVREAFLPTAAEIEWAKRVLAAAKGAGGAIEVEGRMVDRPVMARAQAILDRLRN